MRSTLRVPFVRRQERPTTRYESRVAMLVVLTLIPAVAITPYSAARVTMCECLVSRGVALTSMRNRLQRNDCSCRVSAVDLQLTRRSAYCLSGTRSAVQLNSLLLDPWPVPVLLSVRIPGWGQSDTGNSRHL